MAGCASCGTGAAGLTATSPAAKTRSCPVTRRSAPTSIRPPLPRGSAGRPAGVRAGDPGRPDRDVAAVLAAVGEQHRAGPDLLDRRVEQTSTPRLEQLLPGVLAQRAAGTARAAPGPSRSAGPGTCDLSISGNAAGSAMLRSSASVPASSTPVAPPPTTVMSSSGSVRPSLRRSSASSSVFRSATASRRVYRLRLCSAAPGDAEEGGADAGGDDQVVVAELLARGQRRDPPLQVEAGQLALAEPGTAPAGRAPQRVGDIRRGEPGRGHLVQQRLERAVDVAVDERHAARPSRPAHAWRSARRSRRR